MIKRKKIKSKKKISRKNPFLFTYGYHYTSEKELPKILEEGLKIRDHGIFVTNKVRSFYGIKYPIFFFIDPNVYSSFLARHFIKYGNKNILLRVNIKKFNQLPDLPSFLEPGREFEDDLHSDLIFLSGSGRAEIYFKYDPKYKNIKYLLEMEDRDYLTIDDIKSYPEIQTDIINITGTFAITENVPPENIESYSKVNIFNKDYWKE